MVYISQLQHGYRGSFILPSRSLCDSIKFKDIISGACWSLEVPNETKYYDVGMFVTPIKEGTVSVCGEGESSSGDDAGNVKKRRLG
jgi:hypothetical protein